MLLYFCQGASLAIDNQPLFEEKIRAWENGPVVMSVYKKFSDISNEEDLYKHIDLLDYKPIDKDTTELIIQVIMEIGVKHTDQEFISIVHQHKPWLEATKNGVYLKGATISKKSMKKYFKENYIEPVKLEQNIKQINQDELVMYIILNKDLHMSTGKAAAQAGHVVVNYMEALYNGTQDSHEQLAAHQHWLSNSQPKIVLQAHQNQMQKLLQLSGAYHIIDEGRTEIPADSLTAICFKPMPRSAAPKELRRLQLYRE